MADTYTQSTSLDFSKAAYDRLAYFALRPELYFDQAADVQPTAQSMPGTSVTFTIVNDLSIATAPLSETTDVSAVALSDSQVTLTLAEYGNAVITTAKLRGTSFVEVDPIVANVVGYNAGVSIDSIARNALGLGTQVYFPAAGSHTTRATLSQSSATDILATTDIRNARARLRSQNVPTFGGMYVSYIHPDTVVDIQSQASGANWRDPHVYSQPGEIWSGEMGAFEGVRFIETPRALTYAGAGAGGSNLTITIATGGATFGTFTIGATGSNPVSGDVVTTGTATAPANTIIGSVDISAGSGGTGTAYFVNATTTAAVTIPAGNVTINKGGSNVYGTLILGRQSLAKAYSMVDGNGAVPHVVPGPVTDHLRRLVPMGWYWLGAYGIFRQASVARIEHTTSLGADISTNPPIPPIDLGE